MATTIEKMIRLWGQYVDGAEFLNDFSTLGEARQNVPADADDWVIFELPRVGRYGQCGRVLTSKEDEMKALYRILNVDAGVYIQLLGCTCFVKKDADAMVEDLTGRGYRVKVEPWIATRPGLSSTDADTAVHPAVPRGGSK